MYWCFVLNMKVAWEVEYAIVNSPKGATSGMMVMSFTEGAFVTSEMPRKCEGNVHLMVRMDRLYITGLYRVDRRLRLIRWIGWLLLS